jgi:glutamyl-tRNA reductase
MSIIAIGVNHRTAPVEVRERLAFSKSGVVSVLQEVKQLPCIQGCVVLSTCNRTEVYAAVTQVEQAVNHLQQYLRQKAGLDREQASRCFQVWTNCEAITHLFRVAAGLDSMILGETEILGQVRCAYEVARQNEAGNHVINTLFQEAIRIGKRVRTVTGIDQHPVSVSYAAVELARKVFGELKGRTVLVVGAGEMGELTLKNLVAQGVSTVLVSNRSFERAEVLARTYGGEAIRYDFLFSQLNRADIVISCTGATHFVITADKLRQAVADRGERPLLLIDIAVPRDVEPSVAEIPGVKLYNIDDLQHVVLKNIEERRKAAAAAEKLIEEAVAEFLKWLGTLTVVPTIRALQKKGELIKEEELKRCFNRLGPVDPRTERLIRALAHSLVNKLLRTPILRLKEYALAEEGQLYSKVLENLFALEVEEKEEVKLHGCGGVK